MLRHMAKKKVVSENTDGVLIKTATTIGRAAGKLAALVTSGSKASTKGKAGKTSRKPRTSAVKPRSSGKAAGTNVASRKAKKTVSDRKQKV
jgi:hypothetical protein